MKREHERIKMKTKTKNKVETEVVEVVATKVLRESCGRFKTGTLSTSPGRPKLGLGKLDTLLKAITRVETTKDIKLLDHFVQEAFTDHAVLIALMKKLCPDLKSIAVSTGQGDELSDEQALQIQEKLRKRYQVISQTKKPKSKKN